MTSHRDKSELRERMFQKGRELGAREAEQIALLAAARKLAEDLRACVVQGVEGFRQGLQGAGATHLCDEAQFRVSNLELDNKHVRAVGFSVQRGRYKICIVVKTKGSVTLVGPFHLGKKEGPCQKFAIPTDPTAMRELENAIADLLEAFFEEAMTT